MERAANTASHKRLHALPWYLTHGLGQRWSVEETWPGETIGLDGHISQACAHSSHWTHLSKGKTRHDKERDDLMTTHHLWASILCTHFAVILSRSLMLVVGSTLYFSSSTRGRMAASQYGSMAGSLGGSP